MTDDRTKDGNETREDRLAAALRANLRRRKGQADSRRGGRGDKRSGIALAEGDDPADLQAGSSDSEAGGNDD
ncbi:hypothetical protein HDIA_0800 [Hartmannibacter diazotrophicus]|uniref:Uncharacterized protein n=1 Tax=Hartmannibacter diazotrophicus TaxID=1482074 RepID=A0A2C9D3H3_9HYPH|nr:hypothetical protein [Hartmannibacter diazotrophicus]SON54341.1 hypothetical protein HDIA_0800 [Hartmannibacter diazotrophicus]